MIEKWNQLMEILSWPVEWNSLHGIAQIITPVCKITTASDALSEKRTVRLANKIIPEEAGSGIGFPFVEDTWTDNGFTNLYAMDRAHDKIINVLSHYRPETVLDLGCGNMALLRRIKKTFGSETCGVDQDVRKVPDLVTNIYNFDFNMVSIEFDFVLVAVQRTQENPEKWAVLEKRIEASKTKHLMIYDYVTGEVLIKDYDKTPVSDSVGH